jgi:phosphoribosylpyrophosphate synthetase
MSDFINFEDPKFNTLKPATIKALEKQIAKSIQDNQAAGKGNVVSIKDIPKMQAKFVHNFLELVKSLSDDLHNKNVLIIDDILSSGATFAEMVRLVSKEDVKSLIGLTIFKKTLTQQLKKAA